jgi:hypothetical protein
MSSRMSEDAPAQHVSVGGVEHEQQFLFFLGQSNDRAIGDSTGLLDPAGDLELTQMFLDDPYAFSNDSDLARYGELVSRQACQLLPWHGDQAAGRALAAADIGSSQADQCLIMQYRFRVASELFSGVAPGAPMALTVTLFDAQNYAPQGIAEVLWSRGGSQSGIVAVRKVL